MAIALRFVFFVWNLAARLLLVDAFVLSRVVFVVLYGVVLYCDVLCRVGWNCVALYCIVLLCVV